MKKIILFIILVLFLVSCEGSTSSKESYSEAPQIQGETFWWNDIVFYEIFVRSFYDSDGDGIGDLQGIIAKLDYLNDGNPATTDDLGIGGIWLMPISQSPSYHGYDVIDYKEIESDYGTNEDFLELMDQCHQRGIKVIVDYVMNHSSNQHPWFMESSNEEEPYKDFYLWRDDDPGYTQPWGGTYHVWHPHNNGKYFYGVFWGGMPDLNYNNPAVKDTMFAIADYWLNTMQADGFRCDAVKYIYEDEGNLENLEATYQFWSDFHNHYKGINPDAMAVGEAWDATEIVLNYVDNKFDFCFEFNLAQYIFSAVTTNSPSYIRTKMSEIKELYPYHQYGTFLTNHDQNRIFSTLVENEANNKLAAATYLTLPGIPFVYYGEEIGMLGTKPDENIRRPMQWDSGTNAGFSSGTPWHNINSNYGDYNVAEEQSDPNSIWSCYNKLIQIRNNEPALTKGTYQGINSSNNSVFAYIREYEGDGIVVVHNFSNSNKADIALDVVSSNLFPGNYNVMDLMNTNQEIQSLEILPEGAIEGWIAIPELPAKSSIILKLIKN